MGGSGENTKILDKEEDKENSLPTTPVSERPMPPPALLRGHPFGARQEFSPEDVFENLFHQVLLSMCFDIKSNWGVSFYKNLSSKIRSEVVEQKHF